MRRMMALLLAVLLPLVAVAEEPELNEQGFLADSVTDEEYVLVDVEHGQWVYLSHTLSIRLTRYDEEEGPRRYYVADVRCSPESSLQAYATEGRRVGYTLKNPRAMAVEQEAVLALSDDFSGYRMHNDKRVGIVIRNGNVLSDKTYKSTNRRGWPNLDTLAVYDDGCMETHTCDAYTAEEYLAAGAVQVYAFGPILLQGGEYSDYVLDETYYPYNEPRLAIGMVEPYHYIVLAVEGRTDVSVGAKLPWMAEKLKALGVQEALNLDGGGTAALMFMGEVLNRSAKNMRSVNSIIMFK